MDGQFTANDIPKNPPGTYNSGAMIEMHKALSLTSSAEINAKVKINVPEGKSIELRKTVPPDPQTVRNVIADLFLNKDTWEFDASVTGKAQPGERVRKLLVEHAPELSFILKGLDGNGGLDLLSSLPVGIRDAVKSVLGTSRRSTSPASQTQRRYPTRPRRPSQPSRRRSTASSPRSSIRYRKR